MALPVKLKTWELSLNNIVGPDGTQASEEGTQDRRDLLFGIKTKLIDSGIFTVPWTVSRSCDSTAVTAGDNWSDVGDVLWGLDGNTHSWIVLENSALGIFLCMNLVHNPGSDGATMDMLVSRNAFTGGSTTARPTSVGEMLWIDHTSPTGAISSWGSASDAGSSAPHRFIYHVQMSDDGLCTRILIWFDNFPVGYLAIERPLGAPSSWTNGCVLASAGTKSDSSNLLTVANWLRGAPTTPNRKMYNSPRLTNAAGITGSADAHPVTTSTNQSAQANSLPDVMTGVHPVTGDYVASPQWWYSTTDSVRGLYGRIADCWLVSDTAGVLGDTAPVASEQFFRHGSLLLPWDGATTPILT